MRIPSALLFAFGAVLLPVSVGAFGVQIIVDGREVVLADVPQSAWFATYVQQAADARIISGYRDVRGQPTGRFGPENSVTLAETLKIAVEGAGYDTPLYASRVQSGITHWASAYVSVAKSEGFPIVVENLRRLNRPLTRAEVAALFTAAFHVDTAKMALSSPYTDVDEHTSYAASIKVLSSDGIVSGDTDIRGQATGTFRPTDTVNRAEVAKMIIAARARYGLIGQGRVPAEQSSAGSSARVTYTQAGFSPLVLRVRRGDAVLFRNEDTVGLWIASNPHPSHTALPTFNSMRALNAGEIYSYTFTQVGSWGYHNHLDATQEGTIIVEE